MQMGSNGVRAQRSGERNKNQNRMEEMHAIQLNVCLSTQIIINLRQDMESMDLKVFLNKSGVLLHHKLAMFQENQAVSKMAKHHQMCL